MIYKTCPDCNAALGEKHEDGCDVERCPHCGGKHSGASGSTRTTRAVNLGLGNGREISINPLANRPRADACGFSNGLRRLPALDLPYNPLSTVRRVSRAFLCMFIRFSPWNLKLQATSASSVRTGWAT